MKYYLYTIYDPKIDSFSERITAQVLGPDDMAEQYRRMFLVSSDKDKAFFEGKKACCLGKWDDVSGKITQDEIIMIHEFKNISEGESKEDTGCQDPSKSIQDPKDLN